MLHTLSQKRVWGRRGKKSNTEYKSTKRLRQYLGTIVVFTIVFHDVYYYFEETMVDLFLDHLLIRLFLFLANKSALGTVINYRTWRGQKGSCRVTKTFDIKILG